MLAATRAIVTVEEIVDELTPRPGGVVLPAWTVDAVCEVPGGAHPSYAIGYSVRDNAFYQAWDADLPRSDTFAAGSTRTSWRQPTSPSTGDRWVSTTSHRNHATDTELTTDMKRGPPMAISQQTMTDEQRKSVALEYLKAFDNGGVTSTGGSILDLFVEDAQVMFPKWGVATGRDEIGQLFGDVGGTIKQILHHYSEFNWIMTGTDMFAWRARATASTRRAMAGRCAGVGRGALVRRVRGTRLPDPAVLHLPRSRLRRRRQGRYPWITD